MSKIFVDEIAGIADADTVAIPGHVIQVQHATLGEQGTTSSPANNNASYGIKTTTTTYTNFTDLDVSITPVATNSKIKIELCFYHFTTGAADAVALRIIRGSTVVWEPEQNSNGPYSIDFASTGTGRYGHTTIIAIDEPNTTSEVTYSLQYRTYNGGSTSILFANTSTNIFSAINTMIVTEIAG